MKTTLNTYEIEKLLREVSKSNSQEVILTITKETIEFILDGQPLGCKYIEE